MKKSVLIRRAALITAAIVLTMVVVTLLAAAFVFKSDGKSVMPVFWSCLLGAFAALVVGAALVRVGVMPWVKNLEKLRDVAVSVGRGELDVRADERAPGEIGQLGAALNNVSYQLSRNMYLLIIERNRLKQMLYGLSEGIAAVNAKGRVTHSNPALSKLFQSAPPETGDARLRFVPDESVWEDFDNVVKTGKAVSRNLEMPERVIRLVISPLVDEIGTTAGAVGLFSDITQQERLERTRRDYVANVSHEMRTPLTAMRALIEPLKEGMVTGEEARMRYYGIILREVMRLSRLIDDLMELSRLQSGSLAIQTERVLLSSLIPDVCERYCHIAKEHEQTFVMDETVEKCPPVITNADRVEQLLVILLDNAIKYTPQGGTVSVDAQWDEKRVVITVRDTGIGIDPSDLPYVFDRFYKVDKAHSGMGSGLGLSIAKELLKWMGEEIWVKSERDKGTEFSFTLKRAL